MRTSTFTETTLPLSAFVRIRLDPHPRQYGRPLWMTPNVPHYVPPAITDLSQQKQMM